MPSASAPPDDDPRLRQSYNFAPGYHGLIYRAATNERGNASTTNTDDVGDEERPTKRAKLSHSTKDQDASTNVNSAAKEISRDETSLASPDPTYILQSAKWGLIPFWTKRSPDYSNMLRTINCRDDSLAQPGGMWNTMKQRKRCVVIAEGFYEWLKKNNGKEKVPHFVKRKDGQLMCFAGLWDCVHYEDAKQDEEGLWTYTIITTDSNQQLKFLHDRMPVILEAGSEGMAMWLDPMRIGWDKDLQGLLKPYQGELECYAVDQAVGKVGNNSKSFIVPVASKDNKKNIANFFDKGKGMSTSGGEVKKEPQEAKQEEHEEDSRDTTVKLEDPESNAPLPKPKGISDSQLSLAIEQDADDNAIEAAAQEQTERDIKQETSSVDDVALLDAEESPILKERSPRQVAMDTPEKSRQPERMSGDKTTPAGKRSATTNATVAKTPTKGADKKITSFFGK